MDEDAVATESSPLREGAVVKRLAVPTALLLVAAAVPAAASESMALLPNGTPIISEIIRLESLQSSEPGAV